MMGGVMLVLGALILSGLDKQLETAIVSISPDWLVRLSTSI